MDVYAWVKALHVIAVIAWMAGMLYLPRLYVYHAKAAKGSSSRRPFKVMGQRLLRAIISPAMIAAWALGSPSPISAITGWRGWFPRQAAAALGDAADPRRPMPAGGIPSKTPMHMPKSFIG